MDRKVCLTVVRVIAKVYTGFLEKKLNSTEYVYFQLFSLLVLIAVLIVVLKKMSEE